MNNRYESSGEEIISERVILIVRSEREHGAVIRTPIDNRSVVDRARPLHVDKHIRGHTQDTGYAHVTVMTTLEVDSIVKHDVLDDE